MSFLFALLSFLGWGTGDIFGGTVARKIGGYSSAFWFYVFSFSAMTLYAPFVLNQLQPLTLGTGLLLVFLTIIGLAPLTLHYKAISVGNASLAGTISGSFAALVVLFSIVFFGDKVSFGQGLAIVVIFIGLLLSLFDLQQLKLKQVISDKSVPYALGAMLVWGVYFTLLRIPIHEIGWFWPSYTSVWGFPVLYLIMKASKVKLERPPTKNLWLYSVCAAVLLNSGQFAYNVAITKGEAAIVAPIAGSYPALFALLAYFVFKDRLKKQQVVGIITTLTGIVLLSVLSGG